MAERVEIFDVECPAGTPATAPVEVSVAFPEGSVQAVWVVIPDGHAGLTGIALAVAHQPTIPRNVKSTPTEPWKFIEGNDESMKFDLDGYPESGAWSAFLYNTDVYAHSWQLRFAVSEPRPVAEVPLAPLAPIEGVVSAPVGEGAPAPEAPPSGETPTPPGPPAEPPATPESEPPAPPPQVEPPAPPSPPEEPPAPPSAPEELPAPPSIGEGEPTPAPSDEGEGEGEGEGATGIPGGVEAPPGLAPKVRHPRTRVEVRRESLPAGGWLPHGARFDVRQTDQGQDFITAWRGPIIAPAAGHVVHVLSDRPFPSGFGPRYPVVHIDAGEWGGRDWYIGHTTSAVRAGERFHGGQVLAHADQGLREGGGWVELGPAPGGHPGPPGGGARIASLFHTITRTIRRTVTVAPPHRSPPRHGAAEHPRYRPPAHVSPARAGGVAAPRVAPPHREVYHPPARHIAPAGVRGVAVHPTSGRAVSSPRPAPAPPPPAPPPRSEPPRPRPAPPRPAPRRR